MFKYFAFILLALTCQGSVIKLPVDVQYAFADQQFLTPENHKAIQWSTHFMDFLKLIDVEKVLGVAVQYMNDPEVMNFLGFILGPDFKEIIWEFEHLEEFNEAYLFLASKGYDFKIVIDYINSVLELPPYTLPQRNLEKSSTKGMSGFIIDMLGVLPLEEMRNLLEIKLATDPELAEFVAVLDSPEFMQILRKIRQNPKIKEFTAVFESYGLDFKFICSIIKEMFPGTTYQCVSIEKEFEPLNVRQLFLL